MSHKKIAKMVIALIAVLAILLGVVFLVNKTPENPNRISIVATNFPAYDFARAVAGDQANIKMLVSPGTETHDFEPTPQDIIDIKNSDLFIYTGGESDEWIKGVLSDLDRDKTAIVRMMDAVDVVEEEITEGMKRESESESESQSDSNDESEYDEHVWTSPHNAIQIVSAIKGELSKISPENTAIFTGNANSYIDKLTDLDQNFRDIIKNGHRNTIIFGDRFPLRYFADEYGLTYYAAFPGCSEQTEASSRTIAFLVDKINSEHIPVVFKIELSSGKLAETISNETGAKVLEFHSAHNISSDDFNNDVTYIDLMALNLNALKEALN